MNHFHALYDGQWSEVFYDPCTKDWKQNWTLDGQKATVTNTSQGMDFQAGPVPDEDASHAVLWTKQGFEGDLKIEYEYTRTDSATKYVNIIYIQATGSGEEPYAKDITQWASLRNIAAMRMYFDHMNLYHISYAALSNKKNDPADDYIRARRYLPQNQQGLKNTDLAPDYFRTGLFATGVPHKITVIKKSQEIFMHIKNNEKEMLCHWSNQSSPPIFEGPIGLRHMCTRSARYRDFRVSISK